MPAISTDTAIPFSTARPSRWPDSGKLLLAATCFAAGATLVWGSTASRSVIDADLARVLRFMAGLKLVLAGLALAGSWWRLSRPAQGWRTVAYVVGPPLAIGGSILMLSLTHLSLAALSLHAGLFAVVAAALTDERFLPVRER